MGAGIVLLIWIIVFAIVSGILGGICFFIVYLIVRKKPYKNKGFLYALSLLTPFIFLFSELFIGLIGECFVTDKVDCGFGDYWKAPLNEKFCISAIDDPERAFVHTYEDVNYCIGCGTVKYLWQNEDTVTALCVDKDSTFSLFAFPVYAETYDTLFYQADKDQTDAILQERKLSKNDSMIPDVFFAKAQQKAHRVEAPIRHSIVVLILVGLWWGIIRKIKKEKDPLIVKH